VRLGRQPRRLAVAALLASSAGCAAALKEPPPVSALQRSAVGEPGASAEELLSAGRAAYGKRPDAAEVSRAVDLCLGAARADETGPTGVAGLACAAQSSTWLVEHERSAAVRTDLAVRAVQAGQLCLRRAPASATCRFWLAVALGLQARERPSTGDDALKHMVPLLREAARDEPALDEAGPERVLATLLLRAPAWPLGPGDAEEALALARRAVALRPEHPPNQAVLSEALAKNGEPAAARQAAGRALASARAAAAAGQPDAADWVRQAEALGSR
jgi:tetratricopeptide (TPR) repeat protein